MPSLGGTTSFSYFSFRRVRSSTPQLSRAYSILLTRIQKPAFCLVATPGMQFLDAEDRRQNAQKTCVRWYQIPRVRSCAFNSFSCAYRCRRVLQQEWNSPFCSVKALKRNTQVKFMSSFNLILCLFSESLDLDPTILYRLEEWPYKDISSVLLPLLERLRARSQVLFA